MPSNYQVEATGFIFWIERSRDISFEGQNYSIDFVEMSQKAFQDGKIDVVNDHTARLKVKDPNGLV